MAKKKTCISISIILSLIIFVFGAFLIYFFNVNRGVDLSLIKTGASSVTRIFYFDYEDRENRIGSINELKEEQLFLQKSEWKSLYNMPKHLYNAFIAIEDKRFYEHSGVDFLRTAKATLNYIFGKNKGSFGGSTITQQLIKNLTGDNQATPRRKFEEIVRALCLEAKMSKNEILESYLNIVYLSENCYGVGAGSELYFNKDVSELSLAESAMLAAIVKNPTKYDPYLNYNNNIKRRNIVLEQMLSQGLISENEYKNAINETVKINQNIENEKKSGIYSWFTETLINDVSNDLAKKKRISYDAARRLILKGGFNIYSTIDPNIQNALEEVYEGYSKYILPEGGKYPESACVVLDPQTSDILALVGGVGSKKANMIFNRAVRAKRPPGSVIKPLSVYGPALEENIISYSSVYDDTPVKFVDDKPWPKNSPNKYRGLMPIYYAIEHSTNTVAVKVLKDLGLNKSLKYLDKLFIDYDIDNDKNESSLALGQLTNGETLLNISNAYTAFANGGTISKPKCYLYVTDNYGNVILENNNEKERVFSNQTSYIMTKMLQNVVENGTASSVKLNNENIEISGKTGTSSNNEDRWFIGYSPDYVCGVWTGFDNPKAINSRNNPSCILFKELFNKIYTNESEKITFKSPGGIVSESFCFDSGKLPTNNCSNDIRGTRIINGYFKEGTEPNSNCDIHKELIINHEDGLEADISTYPLFKRRASFVDYTRPSYDNVIILDSSYLLSSRKREE